MTVSSVSLFRARDGIRDAVLDVVANPWTVGTFALVTAIGPMAMNQDRFPRIKGATCWVMRDGMRYTYYVGLGITGAKAVHGLVNDDAYETAHAATLGGMLVTTKLVGDRYMGPFLESLGRQMLRWSERVPARLGAWLDVQGRALLDTATDRMASTGLALCAHSLDEIAALSVAFKAAIKAAAFRQANQLPKPLPPKSLPEDPSMWPTIGIVAAAVALAALDGPLPFGDAVGGSLVSARLAIVL